MSVRAASAPVGPPVAVRLPLAWLVPAVTATAVAAGLLLLVDAPGPRSPYLLVNAVQGVAYPAVGALIAARRPRNPIGWLLCGIGAAHATTVLTGGYAQRGGPGELAAAWVESWVWFLGLGPLLLLPLLLPDGRLPSPRWRPVAWYAGATLTASLVALALFPWLRVEDAIVANPVGVPAAGPVYAALIVAGLAAAVAGLAALALRLRRAADRRALLPVFAAAAVIVAALLAAGPLPQHEPLLQAVTFPLLPLAIAVAIFRYRLFDVELVIRRAVVYLLLAGLLLALYLGVVTGLGALLRRSAGTVESLVATAAVAVAFAPARLAVQRAVSRLLFGNRDDPDVALSRLGRRLGAATTPEHLLNGVAATIAGALAVPAVTVLDATGVVVTAHGDAGADAVRVPLGAEGELRVAPRAPGEPLSPADRLLLTELGGQVAVALAVLRLAREVQVSRERVVLAREEERRHLRRDLHDGLGPAIATVGVQLDIAEARLGDGPERALLADVRRTTRSLVTDVRRITHDLRPAALDELGLAGALDDLAMLCHATADVAGPLPALPAAVEVAAYRIAQEALTNAVRHAGASRIELAVSMVPGRLRLVVTDDGTGVAPDAAAGVGSASMRERAAELGGTLAVHVDGGTTVTAELPV